MPPRDRRTKDQLAAELFEAKQELLRLKERSKTVEEALTEYKERVKDAANEAKNQHGWCSEVDEILENLDINPGYGTVNFTLSLDIGISVEALAPVPSDPDELRPWLLSRTSRAQLERMLSDAITSGYQLIDQDELDFVPYSGDYNIQLTDVDVRDTVVVNG